MRHATFAASAFLALGLTAATGAYAQTKSIDCSRQSPQLAEAGGGNGGRAPQLAESGGGNGGRQPQLAESGGGNGGRAPQLAEAGGGNGGPNVTWKSASANPCP